jgi:hypothetical protein
MKRVDTSPYRQPVSKEEERLLTNKRKKESNIVHIFNRDFRDGGQF